jgi:peptidoglycan/LPS O-acetylase OafA/YrhL
LSRRIPGLAILETQSSKILVSIQALRAVAALMVLFAHVYPHLLRFGPDPNFPNFVAGAGGVDLFFVISGFVMIYASERLFGRPNAVPIFLGRRIARIVPLYWAATASVVILIAPATSTEAIIASLLFWWPSSSTGFPVLSVGWTLNIEMFFYAIFAVALLAGKRLWVFCMASAIIILCLLLSPVTIPLNRFCNPMIIEFVFGMGLAVLYRTGLRLPLWCTLLSVAAGLAVFVVTSPLIIVPASTFPRQYGWGVAAALIVFGTALSSRPSPKNSFGFVFLGDVSYALYLTHNIAFSLLGTYALGLGFNALHHVWMSAAMMMTIAVAIAAGVHLWFEKPITTFLQRQTGRTATRLRGKLIVGRP